MAEMTPTTKSAMHRQFTGKVVSAVEQKTIHVLVKTVKTHAKYRKQFVATQKFAVHDEAGKAKVGDTVVFEECRPLSRTKRWRLITLVK